MKEIGIVVKLLDRFSGELKKGARTAQDSFKAMQNSARTAGTAMNRASGDARKSLVNVQNETRKASNALTKLGRTATSLKLTPNTDGLRKVSAEATRAGGTITQSFTRAATTSSTAMNHLSTTTTTAAARAAGSMQRISTAASSALGRVSTLATSAGTRLTGAFSRAATSISSVFSRVGSAASSAFSRIRKGVSGASASLDTLSSNISGLIGAFGAAQLASESFSAAMERDMFTAYMEMNVGAAKAREFASIIRQINIESPAPGGFINKLITGAIANQASLTASELRLLGQVASDYYMASMMMGKNKIDVEQDLITYINTGNTAEMARTSILKDHVDYLGQQKTISERILALDKALKEEGYRGLSQQQRALIYWELTKDLIMEVFTSLAGSVLPVLAGVMRAFVSLNEATHGWAAALVAGGVGLLVFITALPTLVSLVETVSIGFSLLRGVLVALPGLFAGAAGGAGLLGSAIAFLTGPLGVALIAVTAITAAFIYFYRTNESFRESVDRLGRSIMSVLGGAFRWLAGVAGQVFSVLGRGFQGLLTVFSPVLGVMVAGLTSLGSALQGLWGALQPVVSTVKGFIGWVWGLVSGFYTTTEGVRSLISSLGPLGLLLGLLLNPIQTLRFAFQQLKMAWDQWASSSEGQATLRALGAAFNEVKLALQQVWAALQPVFDALGQAWSELSNAIAPAREASGAVKSVGGSAGGAAGPLQVFVDIIRVVAWLLQNVVVPAVSAFAGFLRFIAPAVQMLAYALSGLISVLVYVGQVVYTVFSFFYQFGQALWSLLNGNITVTEFLKRVWDIFRATIGRILLQIVMSVVRFGAQLISAGLRAGAGFVRSVVSAILGLPGRIWMYLLVAVQRARNWTNRMWAIARQTGQKVIDGVMSFLRRLPGMVWQELLNVIDKIKQAPGAAYQAAVNFGKRVWEGVKKGLGIASPGYIYKDVSDEITRVTREFKDRQDEAAASAKGFADTIVSAASIKGAGPTPTPVAVAAPSMPSPPAAAVPSAPAPAPAPAPSAVTPTVTPDRIIAEWTPIRKIQDITAQTWRGSFDAVRTNFMHMQNTTRASLMNMQNTTRTGTQKIHSSFDAMRRDVSTAMTGVKKAATRSFTEMKKGVVATAEKTKTGSTSHINTLRRNIERFFAYIRSPAGGPAGAPRIGGGGGRSWSFRLPAPAGPSPRLVKDEIRPPSPALISMSSRELRRLEEEYWEDGCSLLPAGGWDQSRRWIPTVNRLIDRREFSPLPGMRVKVGAFRKWPPEGVFGSLAGFIPFISRVIGATRYSFYRGSSGLSIQQLLRRGAFNCYDGARVVAALAHAWGLPASVQCGLSWNGIPHCAARVAGLWFDTTAFQQGYGWTSPRVTGYGGPTSPDIGVGPARIEHHAGDVHINVEVNGAAGLDEKELAKRIMEAVTDNRTIKRLTSHPVFLRRFDEEYGRYAVNDARRTGSR